MDTTGCSGTVPLTAGARGAVWRSLSPPAPRQGAQRRFAAPARTHWSTASRRAPLSCCRSLPTPDAGAARVLGSGRSTVGPMAALGLLAASDAAACNSARLDGAVSTAGAPAGRGATSAPKWGARALRPGPRRPLSFPWCNPGPRHPSKWRRCPFPSLVRASMMRGGGLQGAGGRRAVPAGLGRPQLTPGRAAAPPGAVLKKRKRDEDWATKKAAAAAEAKQKAKAARKDIFKRAEAYVKEYRAQVGARMPGWAAPRAQCGRGRARGIGVGSLARLHALQGCRGRGRACGGSGGGGRAPCRRHPCAVPRPRCSPVPGLAGVTAELEQPAAMLTIPGQRWRAAAWSAATWRLAWRRRQPLPRHGSSMWRAGAGLAACQLAQQAAGAVCSSTPMQWRARHAGQSSGVSAAGRWRACS